MDHRKIIQQSLDYIEAHLKAELSAQELADLAGYSLYHYYRLFQSATGMSVKQYILRRKLLHTIYEISLGTKRIDTVLIYGFETYSSFYKSFLRELGCTPSEYLTHHRAKPPYHINILKEEHMEITPRKAKEILKAWNLHQESLSEIYNKNTGAKQDNTLFIGDNYVLKYTANLSNIQKIIALSKALTKQGLNTPSILPTLDGEEYIFRDGLYFLVTHRMTGHALPLLEFYHGTAANAMGQAIGKLHLTLKDMDIVSSESDILTTLTTWAVPTAGKALNLSSIFCDEYLSTIRCLSNNLPKQPIHRDPNPGNILFDDNRFGFLDFELSEQNFRIYDPCYAATSILSESDPNQDKLSWIPIYKEIFNGYNSIIPLTPEERQAVPYIIPANQLICVAWFSEQEKYKELFEINKAMTLWLIDHFEELRI